MYLLNQKEVGEGCDSFGFTFHYVSIKSFQLTKLVIINNQFTFHYVSIKSTTSCGLNPSDFYLHSTMYLLNLAFPHIPDAA